MFAYAPVIIIIISTIEACKRIFYANYIILVQFVRMNAFVAKE